MALFSKPFLPYPNMERQDLTQGQLGSFKFTPVDTIQRHLNERYPTALVHQDMLTQLHRPAQCAVAMASDMNQYVRFDSASLVHDSLLSRSNGRSLTTDSVFFNKYIKTDLADSRLMYGPAALRSAVESHSPQKTQSRPQSSHLSHLAATNNEDMNPSAFTFVPTTRPTSRGFDDPNVSLQALARSLAAEQHAHHATQMTLSETMTKLAELGAAMEKVEKDNQSLTSTVNMLKGIIKHNQRKLSQEERAPTKAGQLEKMGTVKSAEPVNEVSPIVYDVLAKQYDERLRRRSTEEETTSLADCVQGNIEIDDSDLFNFDLLNSPAHDESRGSALRRTLGRHFFQPDEETGFSRFSQEITPLRRIDRLISLSPEDSPSHDKLASLKAASQSLHQETDTMAPAPTEVKTTVVFRPGLDGGYETDDSQLNIKPVLQLPQSFLAKYKTPQLKAQQAKAVKAEDKTYAVTGNIEPAVASPHSAPTQLPSVLHSSTPRHVAKLPPTFDLNIKWIINRENPIWDDDDEKLSALGHPYSTLNQKNAFWEYPVRYIEYADKNLFRTIMIDYIPVGTQTKDVLKEICGGSVEQVELFGPIGTATGYMTARVVFNYELSASTVANHARDHGMKIGGKEVRVWQVLTQTWPKNKQVDEDVFVSCYTRVLLITNVSDDQLASVPNKLARLRKSIVDSGVTYDGLPMIEFASVTAAVEALHQLVSDPDLSGAAFDFEEDPCAEPYPAGE